MQEQLDKIKENRMRRIADRRGFRLEKSKRRDPQAPDFGTYQLVDAYTNMLAVWGRQDGYGLSLDEVEAALNEGAKGKFPKEGRS